jgi:DtxR family transcriptional regulator, Mn-dependent transcriptional regulator
MAKTTIKLSANMEDYLEAIIVLQQEKGVARVKDISDKMNVRKPSVTAAMNLLAVKGFIAHERYGHIELSVKGKRLANAVKERHEMLRRFFSHVLGVSSGLAEADACKIEHSLSQETFSKFSRLIEFIEKQDIDRNGTWRDRFQAFLGLKKKKRTIRMKGK